MDTNVISEITKPAPNQAVVRWLDKAPALITFASVITLGELRIGIEGLPPDKRRTQLEDWLEHAMPDWFKVNALPVSREIFGPVGKAYDCSEADWKTDHNGRRIDRRDNT